ncbi:unnamed protein product [Phytophthora fragariaefolia]|uniref:Unnamed protein product n=1 Tax=Phytophthora fragariaefolia TaxID=1490495 RepID=A0A9W6YAA2_9STRA|nr:unnamed protein product [Phytophthora fragariaefolia]
MVAGTKKRGSDVGGGDRVSDRALGNKARINESGERSLDHFVSPVKRIKLSLKSQEAAVVAKSVISKVFLPMTPETLRASPPVGLIRSLNQAFKT